MKKQVKRNNIKTFGKYSILFRFPFLLEFPTRKSAPKQNQISYNCKEARERMCVCMCTICAKILFAVILVVVFVVFFVVCALLLPVDSLFFVCYLQTSSTMFSFSVKNICTKSFSVSSKMCTFSALLLNQQQQHTQNKSNWLLCTGCIATAFFAFAVVCCVVINVTARASKTRFNQHSIVQKCIFLIIFRSVHCLIVSNFCFLFFISGHPKLCTTMVYGYFLLSTASLLILLLSHCAVSRWLRLFRA